jgi:hypothetical protein
MSAAPIDTTFPPTQRIGYLRVQGLRADRRPRLRRGFRDLLFSRQGLLAAVTLIARLLDKVKSANGPAGRGHEARSRQSSRRADDPGRRRDSAASGQRGRSWRRGRAARLGAADARQSEADDLRLHRCSGAAVFARVGLYGLPAATNHGSFTWVAQQGPKVLWDSVSRWVDAGRYVTSAGVSAGTDLGFYLCPS